MTRGWTAATTLSPLEAVRALEPFVGAFLHTQVETEGMLTGLDIAAAKAVRDATRRRVIAAGGIRSVDEVTALDLLGIDAVVGMAIYTNLLPIE